MNLATAANGNRSTAASRSLWRMAAAPLAVALAMTWSGKAAADPPPYDYTYMGASGGTDLNGVGIAGDPAPQTPVAVRADQSERTLHRRQRGQRSAQL